MGYVCTVPILGTGSIYSSVPNSSDGSIFEKRRAKDGRFLTKIRALDGRKDGRRRAKFKFLFLKKARKFDSRLFSWLHWLGRESKLKIMRRNHLLRVPYQEL